MKKIVALISKETNNEVIVSTAIQMAKLLQLEIWIYHLVEAPHNWSGMSRYARENYPTERLEINEAREVMNHYLAIVRAQNITAKKEHLFYDAAEPKAADVNNAEALVITDKLMFNGKSESLIDFLCDFTPVKLIVGTQFNLAGIEDVVLSSDFHTLLPQSVALLNALVESMDFNLNLVFINTPQMRENSEISIANMKRAIATNGFPKTSISIFNAECRLKGAESFANIRGGDLILTEEQCRVDMTRLEEKHLPVVIVNKW